MAMHADDPGQLMTKPHGHGDVHRLLYTSGTLRRLEEQGYKWLYFFQDTNALALKPLAATLGLTAQVATPCTYTLHSTPYTLHPTPYTLHPTPYTLHPTPYTLHPTPYACVTRAHLGFEVEVGVFAGLGLFCIEAISRIGEVTAGRIAQIRVRFCGGKSLAGALFQQRRRVVERVRAGEVERQRHGDLTQLLGHEIVLHEFVRPDLHEHVHCAAHSR